MRNCLLTKFTQFLKIYRKNNAMKKISILVFVLSLLMAACSRPAEKERVSEINVYDSVLAQSLGADEYGMKVYVMAFLMRGDNPPKDETHSMELQRAHMNNINRLAEEGKLVVAGPFFGNDSLRGIYLFDVQEVEEARRLTQTDPAIQYGSLKMVLKKWYGSAALMQVNDTHNRIAKNNP